MNHSGLPQIMAVAAFGAMILTPLCAEKASPPTGEHRVAKMRSMRRHSMVWRVFSQLSEAERKKMHELQRSNPEAFSAAMRKLVDQYEQKERLRAKKLWSLIRKYRQSTDNDERAKAKAEVVKMEKERFEHRLQELSRTIESTKRRLVFMEQELNKRKAKKDAIVEARAEAILSGELPVRFPFHHPRRGNLPVRPKAK